MNQVEAVPDPAPTLLDSNFVEPQNLPTSIQTFWPICSIYAPHSRQNTIYFLSSPRHAKRHLPGVQKIRGEVAGTTSDTT